MCSQAEVNSEGAGLAKDTKVRGTGVHVYMRKVPWYIQMCGVVQLLLDTLFYFPVHASTLPC